MKTKHITLVLLAFLSLSTTNAQVGIGTTNPHASAILDVESTDKGFLPPRMETTDRDAIVSPAEGLTIFNTTNGCLEFYNGTDWISACDGSIVTTTPCSGVTAPAGYGLVAVNGMCWLDRNLGATTVTQTARGSYSTDAAYIAAESSSFGDLYQWGRGNDGHQSRTSPLFDAGNNNSNLPSTAAAVTNPTWNGQFIHNMPSPFDWHQANPDNTLWQPATGTNNPCPTGFRVPTQAEWSGAAGGDGVSTIAWAGLDDAFNSPLKLPAAGGRAAGVGVSASGGIFLGVWTSTISGSGAVRLLVSDSGYNMTAHLNAFGWSVRCVAD